MSTKALIEAARTLYLSDVTLTYSPIHAGALGSRNKTRENVNVTDCWLHLHHRKNEKMNDYCDYKCKCKNLRHCEKKRHTTSAKDNQNVKCEEKSTSKNKEGAYDFSATTNLFNVKKMLQKYVPGDETLFYKNVVRKCRGALEQRLRTDERRRIEKIYFNALQLYARSARREKCGKDELDKSNANCDKRAWREYKDLIDFAKKIEPLCNQGVLTKLDAGKLHSLKNKLSKYENLLVNNKYTLHNSLSLSFGLKQDVRGSSSPVSSFQRCVEKIETELKKRTSKKTDDCTGRKTEGSDGSPSYEDKLLLESLKRDLFGKGESASPGKATSRDTTSKTSQALNDKYRKQIPIDDTNQYLNNKRRPKQKKTATKASLSEECFTENDLSIRDAIRDYNPDNLDDVAQLPFDEDSKTNLKSWKNASKGEADLTSKKNENTSKYGTDLNSKSRNQNSSKYENISRSGTDPTSRNLNSLKNENNFKSLQCSTSQKISGLKNKRYKKESNLNRSESVSRISDDIRELSTLSLGKNHINSQQINHNKAKHSIAEKKICAAEKVDLFESRGKSVDRGMEERFLTNVNTIPPNSQFALGEFPSATGGIASGCDAKLTQNKALIPAYMLDPAKMFYTTTNAEQSSIKNYEFGFENDEETRRKLSNKSNAIAEEGGTKPSCVFPNNNRSRINIRISKREDASGEKKPFVELFTERIVELGDRRINVNGIDKDEFYDIFYQDKSEINRSAKERLSPKNLNATKNQDNVKCVSESLCSHMTERNSEAKVIKWIMQQSNSFAENTSAQENDKDVEELSRESKNIKKSQCKDTSGHFRIMNSNEVSKKKEVEETSQMVGSDIVDNELLGEFEYDEEGPGLKFDDIPLADETNLSARDENGKISLAEDCGTNFTRDFENDPSLAGDRENISRGKSNENHKENLSHLSLQVDANKASELEYFEPFVSEETFLRANRRNTYVVENENEEDNSSIEEENRMIEHQRSIEYRPGRKDTYIIDDINHSSLASIEINSSEGNISNQSLHNKTKHFQKETVENSFDSAKDLKSDQTTDFRQIKKKPFERTTAVMEEYLHKNQNYVDDCSKKNHVKDCCIESTNEVDCQQRDRSSTYFVNQSSFNSQFNDGSTVSCNEEDDSKMIHEDFTNKRACMKRRRKDQLEDRLNKDELHDTSFDEKEKGSSKPKQNSPPIFDQAEKEYSEVNQSDLDFKGRISSQAGDTKKYFEQKNGRKIEHNSIVETNISTSEMTSGAPKCFTVEYSVTDSSSIFDDIILEESGEDDSAKGDKKISVNNHWFTIKSKKNTIGIPKNIGDVLSSIRQDSESTGQQPNEDRLQSDQKQEQRVGSQVYSIGNQFGDGDILKSESVVESCGEDFSKDEYARQQKIDDIGTKIKQAKRKSENSKAELLKIRKLVNSTSDSSAKLDNETANGTLPKTGSSIKSLTIQTGSDTTKNTTKTEYISEKHYDKELHCSSSNLRPSGEIVFTNSEIKDWEILKETCQSVMESHDMSAVMSGDPSLSEIACRLLEKHKSIDDKLDLIFRSLLQDRSTYERYLRDKSDSSISFNSYLMLMIYSEILQIKVISVLYEKTRLDFIASAQRDLTESYKLTLIEDENLVINAETEDESDGEENKVEEMNSGFRRAGPVRNETVTHTDAEDEWLAMNDEEILIGRSSCKRWMEEESVMEGSTTMLNESGYHSLDNLLLSRESSPSRALKLIVQKCEGENSLNLPDYVLATETNRKIFDRNNDDSAFRREFVLLSSDTDTDDGRFEAKKSMMVSNVEKEEENSDLEKKMFLSYGKNEEKHSKKITLSNHRTEDRSLVLKKTKLEKEDGKIDSNKTKYSNQKTSGNGMEIVAQMNESSDNSKKEKTKNKCLQSDGQCVEPAMKPEQSSLFANNEPISLHLNLNGDVIEDLTPKIHNPESPSESSDQHSVVKSDSIREKIQAAETEESKKSGLCIDESIEKSEANWKCSNQSMEKKLRRKKRKIIELLDAFQPAENKKEDTHQVTDQTNENVKLTQDDILTEVTPMDEFFIDNRDLIEELNNPALILDMGSGYIKAGLSTWDEPVTIPCLVGRPNYQKVLPGSMHSEWFGSEAIEHRGMLKLSHPVCRGVIKNWGDMEKIWRAAFKEMRLSPEEHPIISCIPPYTPKKDLERMMEIMMEEFNTPGFYAASQAVMNLYSSGRTSGLVLDCGDHVTHAIPVYEGHHLPHAVERLELGGRDVGQRLATLLHAKYGKMFTSSAEMDICREVKEKFCFVKTDEESMSDLHMDYQLPDGSRISVEEERYEAPEVLFRPDILGVENSGVSELVLKSLAGVDQDLHRTFTKNIFLSGGSTCFRGFDKRLERELRAQMGGALLRLHRPSNAVTSGWHGASVLGSLSTVQWITRDEIYEHGRRVLHMKCF